MVRSVFPFSSDRFASAPAPRVSKIVGGFAFSLRHLVAQVVLRGRDGLHPFQNRVKGFVKILIDLKFQKSR
uniref:Uncharacterized protein n=1 Tax=Rhizophora mucronata TaxID=61149 RepID=A0A2P2QGF8_RHIMU